MRYRRESRSKFPAVLFVATALFLAACGSDNGTDTFNSESPDNRALSSLCRAVALANNGDGEQASAVFRNDVHRSLHDLAARTSRRDRAVTADLLEAKHEVETAIDDHEAELGPPLASLLAATRAAITVTGTTPAKCDCDARDADKSCLGKD